MSKEILLLAEALASEKNVSNEIVFEALEVALGIAAKKKADREQMDLEIRIDRETGDYKTIRKWLIVEDLDYTYPELEKTKSAWAITTKKSCPTKPSDGKPRKPPSKSSCNASAMPSASKF